MLLLQDVVDHLEKTRHPLSAEQITDAVQHDIIGNAELFQQLQSNPKIRLHPDGQYEYKVNKWHMHATYCFEDLMACNLCTWPSSWTENCCENSNANSIN